MFDYVILLCADKKQSDGTFPDYRNGSFIGGDHLMRAFARYIKENPKQKYIVVGGVDPDSTKSTKVRDMVDYCKTETGIDVIGITSLPCIRHNLIALFNKYGEQLAGRKIAIFNTECYLPRTKYIYQHLRTTEFPEISVADFISPESIIGDCESLSDHPEKYQARLITERQGLADLKNNCYTDYCLETKRASYVKVAHSDPQTISIFDRL